MEEQVDYRYSSKDMAKVYLIDETCMTALCYSYYKTIKNSLIRNEDKERCIQKSVAVICKRFGAIILKELVDIKNNLKAELDMREVNKIFKSEMSNIDIEELRQLLFILKYVKPTITRIIKEHI